MLEPKDFITIGISCLALVVSGSLAWATFVFNRQKYARDLWQKNLELYLAHPAHTLGRPKDSSDEAKQAYRIHVAFVLMALEELLSVFPNDAGWQTIVRRHIARHADYVEEVQADPDRLRCYSKALQLQMAGSH